MKAYIYQTASVLILITLCMGCSKFLDEKSDMKLVTPNSLEALQAILDNPSVSMASFCYSGELSADDYQLLDASYANMADEIQRRYRWAPTELFQTAINEWEGSYSAIYAMNTVLQALEGMEKNEANASSYNAVKGQALVLRGLRFLDLASVFCLAYDEETSDSDLGLPLRLDPDFNVPSVRSSVKQTYQQILADLEQSITLLPDHSINAYRATKPLAYALLARTHLYMRQYDKAAAYADSCLQLQSALIDFNTLDFTQTYPIPALNEEVILQGSYYHTAMSRSNARIEETIYDQYEDDDLRKTCFFIPNARDGSWEFRGTFTGRGVFTVAPTTSEIWIIKAECYARNGEAEQALHCINHLLEHRMKEGGFVGYSYDNFGNADNLLGFVLKERRKELLLRGVRWMDVKRLNKEGREISLTRHIAGETYVLPANDPRFALPLPENVIDLSAMPQNPR